MAAEGLFIFPDRGTSDFKCKDGEWNMDYAGRGTKDIKKVEGLLTVCGDSRSNYAVPRGQEKERNKKYTEQVELKKRKVVPTFLHVFPKLP